MPPRFPRFNPFARPYVSEIPPLRPGFEGVKQAAQEGFEFGLNAPAGAYDSRYGRSLVTTRTPAPLKEGMTPVQTAARVAGRTIADAATFSSQGAYYAINHPAAIAQEVVQRGFRGIGASKMQSALTALGVGTTLAIGSKWYGANPLDYFRPQGYAASAPDPNDPKQTSNPGIELFERFRGRRGNLLPYQDFIKENNLNPNDFTYAKYRDLQRFQRNQVATEAPIGYDTLNKELGLNLTRDQFYGKAPIERSKATELLYRMGVPDAVVRQTLTREATDNEWYTLQKQGLNPKDYISLNLSSVQEKAGLNLGAERDPNFMSGIVRYSNNPYYGAGGALNTFGVDTTVGALVGAGMAGATAYGVIRNQNQRRYQELGAKVRPLANGQIDDSALTARERTEYQRLSRAFADPQTRFDQQRAAELESIDRIVGKTRLPDYSLSQTRSPDRLAQLDPVQLRNEARSRGIRVTPDTMNEYLIDKIMEDNVRRGFAPAPDSPQTFRSPGGAPPRQKPMSAPSPQSQPVPPSRSASSSPPPPKATATPPTNAYEQAYQAVKKTNLRTPGEIVDKVLQYAPGLPSDDTTREAIANQFIDRMSREAAPPPGSDIGFRSPELNYQPMSGRQSLKSRMRGGMSGMGNMDMGLFGGGGGRQKTPTYDPAQVLGEAKQQIDRWMQSPDQRKLELRVGAENPQTGQGALYLYARKSAHHLEGQRTPAVEFANVQIDPSLQRQGVFKALAQHVAETYPDQGQYIESIGNKGWGERLLQTGWTRDPADGGFSVYRTPQQIQSARIQDIQTRIDAAKARMGIAQRSPLLEARALGGRQSLRQRMAGGMSRMGGAQMVDGFEVGGRYFPPDQSAQAQAHAAETGRDIKVLGNKTPVKASPSLRPPVRNPAGFNKEQKEAIARQLLSAPPDQPVTFQSEAGSYEIQAGATKQYAEALVGKPRAAAIQLELSGAAPNLPKITARQVPVGQMGEIRTMIGDPKKPDTAYTRTTQAEVFGDYAVHRATVGQNATGTTWTVTHVPSGLTIDTGYNKPEMARAAAIAYRDNVQLPPLEFGKPVDPESIPEATRAKITQIREMGAQGLPQLASQWQQGKAPAQITARSSASGPQARRREMIGRNLGYAPTPQLSGDDLITHLNSIEATPATINDALTALSGGKPADPRFANLPPDVLAQVAGRLTGDVAQGTMGRGPYSPTEAYTKADRKIVGQIADAAMELTAQERVDVARRLTGGQSLQGTRIAQAEGLSPGGRHQLISTLFDTQGDNLEMWRSYNPTAATPKALPAPKIKDYAALRGGDPLPASRPRIPAAPPVAGDVPGRQWWQMLDNIAEQQSGRAALRDRRSAVRAKLEGLKAQFPSMGAEMAAQIDQQLSQLGDVAPRQLPPARTPAPSMADYPAKRGGFAKPQPLTPHLPGAPQARPYPYRPSPANTPGSLDYRIETAAQKMDLLQGAKRAEVPMIEGGYPSPAATQPRLPGAPNPPAYTQQPARLRALPGGQRSLQELFAEADRIGSKYQTPGDPISLDARRTANSIVDQAMAPVQDRITGRSKPADMSKYRRNAPLPTATAQRAGDLARQIGTLENVPGAMSPTRAKAIESLTAQYQSETGKPYVTDYPPLETGQPQPAPLRPRLPAAPAPQPYPYQPRPIPTAQPRQFRDLPPQPGSVESYRGGMDQMDADRRFREWHQSIRDMRASARENLRVPGTIGAKPAPITSFANPIRPPVRSTPINLDVPRPMTGSEVALAEAYARNPNAGYRAAELPGNGVTVYEPATRTRALPPAVQDMRLMGELRRLQQSASQIPAPRTALRNPPAVVQRSLPMAVGQPTRQLPFSFSSPSGAGASAIETPRALPTPIRGQNLTPTGSPRNLPVSASRSLPATIEAPAAGTARPPLKTAFDFWSSYPVGNTNRPGTPAPPPPKLPSRIPGIVGVGTGLIPVAQEFARAQDQGASVPRSLLRGGLSAVTESVRFAAEPIAEGVKSAIADIPSIAQSAYDIATGNSARAAARAKQDYWQGVARRGASSEWWSSLPERIANTVLGTERDPYSDVAQRAERRYSQAVATRRLQIDPRTGAVRSVDRNAAPPPSFDAQLRREAQASQAARNARLQAHQQHIARIQADQNARQYTIARANQNIANQRRMGITNLEEAVAHKFFGDLGGAQGLRNMQAGQRAVGSGGSGGGGAFGGGEDARIQQALADYRRRNADAPRINTSIEQGGSGISLGGGGAARPASSGGGFAIMQRNDRFSESPRSQPASYDASSIPASLRPEGDAFNEMSPRERAGITREFGGMLREGVRSQDRRYTTDQRLVGVRETNDTRRDIAGIQSGDRRYTADRNYAGRVRVAQIGGDSRRYAADQGLAGRTYAADRGYEGRIGAAQIGASSRAYAADRGYEGRTYAADQSLRGRVYAADQGYAGRAYAADRAASSRLGAADITGQYKVAAADLKGGYDLERERHRNLYGQSAQRMAALSRAFAIRY